MHPTASCFSLLATLFLTSYALQLRPPVAGACLPRERDALLAFKDGITADPGGRLASWRPGEDSCRWRGVRCSNRTGHVLRLNLRYSFSDSNFDEDDLVGQISPALLSLEHLEYLDLSYNSLEGPTGRFPDFLVSLKSLRYLNLSGIQFTGMLPPQLGNLSKLQYLDLSYMGSIIQLQSTDLSWLAHLPLLHYINLNLVDLSMVVDWSRAVNMLPSLRVLSLSGCSLQSAKQSLPDLNLTKLEKLDLSENYFDHPSKSYWFWNLTSLKHLDLADTSLYGQFPNELGDMASLQVFDYSGNNVTGIMALNLLRNLCNLEFLNLESSLPSVNMTVLIESLPHCPSKKLQELNLAKNNIHGTLPTGIGQITSLVTLDLSYNQLTGHVPADITMLTSLTCLDLRYNDLKGVITEEHFAGLQSLKYIGLSQNHLKIVLGPQWSPPPELEQVHFASCQMGPQFPAWLQRLASADWIDISSTGITDQLPDWLSTAFSKVTYLDISSNRISGGLPTNMEVMSLGYLNLGSNQLTGEIPPLPRNLTHLDISKNALSGRVLGSICKSQKLKVLDLANNLLEGEFPQCFGMRNVTALFLSNNRFSGKFPSFLQSCTDLAFLDLSRNKLYGRLPMWIGDLMGLGYLRLSYNTFSGNIPFNITNLRELYDLNLAGNRLSGVIPGDLSNLMTMAGKPIDHYQEFVAVYDQEGKVVDDDKEISPAIYNLSVVTKRQELYYDGIRVGGMLSIDLSSNCLTGVIPEEVASLDALINLNLSWNYLSGKIPQKIASMQSLESLDLSRNKLSGEIPPSLSNLTYLGYLDLSYNNLSGRIPTGSQLDTLYANHPYMYSGNNDLCGPPLQRNCSGGIASKQGDGDHKRTAHIPDPTLFYLGLGSGFVVGLWVVYCTLLFMKTWRSAYFHLLDKVYDKIHVFVIVAWASLAQKKTIQ